MISRHGLLINNPNYWPLASFGDAFHRVPKFGPSPWDLQQ